MGKKTMRKVGGMACFMKSFGRRGMLQMYMGKWAEKVNFTFLITNQFFVSPSSASFYSAKITAVELLEFYYTLID